MTDTTISDALEEMRVLAEEARADLATLPSEHRFAMEGECEDRHGTATRALVIRLDPTGFMGMYMKIGSPYSVSTEKGVAEDRAVTNAWLNVMANIELNSESNLAAVGMSALDAARAAVQNFFMLKLASSAIGPPSPDGSSSFSPQDSRTPKSEQLSGTSSTPVTADSGGPT